MVKIFPKFEHINKDLSEGEKGEELCQLEEEVE